MRTRFTLRAQRLHKCSPLNYPCVFRPLLILALLFAVPVLGEPPRHLLQLVPEAR